MNALLHESDGSLFSRIFGVMENVNKLTFPHEESVYEFKWEDLENLGLLVGKKFIYYSPFVESEVVLLLGL
jgi:hypothetical protein